MNYTQLTPLKMLSIQERFHREDLVHMLLGWLTVEVVILVLLKITKIL